MPTYNGSLFEHLGKSGLALHVMVRILRGIVDVQHHVLDVVDDRQVFGARTGSRRAPRPDPRDYGSLCEQFAHLFGRRSTRMHDKYFVYCVYYNI
jgi:hypothetical protein